MKDIVITGERRKKELLILLICFLAAFALNIASIIIYKTSWTEVFSQIGYVVVIAVLFYLVLAMVRFLVCWIRKLVGKRG